MVEVLQQESNFSHFLFENIHMIKRNEAINQNLHKKLLFETIKTLNFVVSNPYKDLTYLPYVHCWLSIKCSNFFNNENNESVYTCPR